MRKALYFGAFLLSFCSAIALPYKVLHLTFHRGCAEQIELIGEKLSFALTTWYIPDLPPQFLDGYGSGTALYNVGHERAEKIWQLHSSFFDQFDLIITSDTAPLSRIFLQNNSKTPLIIWICNRFDYSDAASLDCLFPDREYYQLFDGARSLPHVVVVANTRFEHAYAQSKGVDTGSLVIQPIGVRKGDVGENNPSRLDRETLFYLPQYHNERFFMDLSQQLLKKGIPNYCGRHNGLGDLARYRAIIHLPYSWSTIALFESLSVGIPYFIPSKTFLHKLLRQNNYWHQNGEFLFEKGMIALSEWYSEEHQGLFTYFNSWDDLALKLDECDYATQRDTIRTFARQHENAMLAKWQSVLYQLFPGGL